MKKLVLLLAVITSMGVNAQNSAERNVVNVNGEGTVNVVPDQVTISSRIETEGLNAEDVKKENDEIANNIFKYLKSQGVAEKNIQTEYVNLNKRTDYNTKEETYVANQSISIKLENLKNYEKIMQGLLKNGLNRINSVSFSSSNMEEYQKEARKKAVLDAKQKAEDLVAPLDQEIGKAVMISESSQNNYPVMRMAEMKSSQSSDQQTIAPGEMEISVSVTISFQLY
ncbi:SIMPL domain-containing protein [Zunongwangia sp. HGR-M22]|uniref:SIMPL domain-containing protein n=1 Tax=Zunongwangia sp. HGR-M22 TaxID=3015168 RepID=UPI0022DE56B0|nr:SIMPL domain-containing protein [Zunongwangia sp. HGR-M22]WBL26928.1 SIMPL domain-containing protein [Zunongwangia sp. HGR-M22]